MHILRRIDNDTTSGAIGRSVRGFRFEGGLCAVVRGGHPPTLLTLFALHLFSIEEVTL
jgi:hypothetical protein